MRIFLSKTALCILLSGFFTFSAQAETLLILRESNPIASFQIEIAESHEDKMRGLMFRESLPKNSGMLFPYSPPINARMWMKNTLIPLDMLFIDTNQKIAHIHHNAIPHSLTPIGSGQDVVAVIEINGGEAKAQNIQLGDSIRIERGTTQGNTK